MIIMIFLQFSFINNYRQVRVEIFVHFDIKFLSNICIINKLSFSPVNHLH